MRQSTGCFPALLVLLGTAATAAHAADDLVLRDLASKSPKKL